MLIRTDAAGATYTFATHLAAQGAQFSLGEHGVQIKPRDGAWVAEITELVDLSA